MNTLHVKPITQTQLLSYYDNHSFHNSSVRLSGYKNTSLKTDPSRHINWSGDAKLYHLHLYFVLNFICYWQYNLVWQVESWDCGTTGPNLSVFPLFLFSPLPSGSSPTPQSWSWYLAHSRCLTNVCCCFFEWMRLVRRILELDQCSVRAER